MMRFLLGGGMVLLMAIPFGCVPETKSTQINGGEESSEPQQRDEFERRKDGLHLRKRQRQY